MIRDRRSFLRFAAGIGLGAVAAETYERLYNIPSLERRFRSEVSHWMNEYNSAKETVEKLSQQLNVSRDEISRLSGEVNNWKNQYNVARDEVNRLGSTVNILDELEKESTEAISFYRERMEEAIRRLKNTIEKYRAILGDERVSFESSSLKVLEDLKTTQENLLKVLPYFPLIRSLEYNPSKVVNDKIYSLNVSLEVISPLNTLKEVEVMLIPVEYRYLITKYGMREEDYDKVFPKEEVRSIKIEPRKLEKEMFSVELEDLKGGREYIVRARVKDVAGNERTQEIKTPYIRQFENLAIADGITVAAFYYNWYTPGYDIPKDLPDKPLLGLYYSDDDVIFNKHIDWATGYGIDVFVFPYPYPQPTKAFDWLEGTFRKNMETELFKQIKFSFLSTFVDNSSPQPPHDFDDPKVKQEFMNNINHIKEHYAKLPNFWKIDGKPVIATWSTHAYQSKEGNIRYAMEKIGSRKDVSLIGEVVGTGKPNFEWYEVVDSIYTYQPLLSFADSVWPHAGGKWGVYKVEDVLNEVLLNMKKWRTFIEKYEVKFFPTVSPGNDKTYDYRDNNRPSIILRDPYSFLKFVKTTRNEFLDEKIKVIFVCSFNEWFEQTQLEPTRDYGFEYLKSLYKGLS
jgi:archaellum component FlaC